MSAVMGWDIGGAHVKAVRLGGDGQISQVWHRSAPLWKGLENFTQAVREIREDAAPGAVRHAVTMTGELTDIFSSRAEGVGRIAYSLAQVLPGEQTMYFAQEPRFVSDPEAQALQVGSMNWYASAQLVARFVECGVFVDVGSTTTDLVRLEGNRAEAVGFTDAERLVSRELLYTGVARTSLMSLADRVDLGGASCNLVAEHFATMADVYNLLGRLPDSLQPFDTADGMGCSVAKSARRLARMVGQDCAAGEDMVRWTTLAQVFAELQQARITENLQVHVREGASGTLVGAGTGRFVLPSVAARCGLPYQDIDTLLAPRMEKSCGLTPADCLPAYSVAELYRLEHAHY